MFSTSHIFVHIAHRLVLGSAFPTVSNRRRLHLVMINHQCLILYQPTVSKPPLAWVSLSQTLQTINKTEKKIPSIGSLRRRLDKVSSLI